MSKLSQQKKNQIVRNLLIGSDTIYPEDFERFEIAQYLHKEQLLLIESKNYVKCVNSEDSDILFVPDYNCDCSGVVYANEDGRFLKDEYYCPDCGRIIFPQSKQKFKLFTTNINWDGLQNWVFNKFRRIDNNARILDDGVIEIIYNQKKVFICIANENLCRSNRFSWSSFSYNDPIVNVYTVIPNLIREYIDLTVTIDLIGLLGIKNDGLVEIVENSLSHYRRLSDREQFEKDFDTFVNSLSDTEFEKFCLRLLNYFTSENDQIKNYIAYLRRYKNTIHGKYFVHLSGPGLADGFIWSKYDYLKNLFEGKYLEGHVEVKKYYGDTSVDSDDFSRFVNHAMDKPGILITTTSKIKGPVWNKIQEWRNNKGWYRFIIIDRELLLELIVQTNATELYQEKYD